MILFVQFMKMSLLQEELVGIAQTILILITIPELYVAQAILFFKKQADSLPHIRQSIYDQIMIRLRWAATRARPASK